MMGRVFACVVMLLGVAQVTSAEPLQDAAPQVVPAQMRASGHVDANPMIAIRAAMVGTDIALGAVVVNTSVTHKTPTCAGAVLGCGYGSGPKRGALPWDFRRAGAGVAFTILGADVAIQRDAFRVVKSMSF